MKKLLVILMAAIMVLSVAAVSMAAATVEGDWRTEWVKNADDDLGFSLNDLRLNFKGQVSDTVDAYMQYTFGTSVALKEYKVTFKQGWGTVTAGQWDHKLLPDRVILKLHGINCVNSKDEGTKKGMQWLFDIPVGDAFTFGLWMLPTLEEDMMDYDVKLAYNADQFGAEVHYGMDQDIEADYQSFSVYYKPIDNLKVFVEGINASDEYLAKLGDKAWDDNLASAIGAQFKNIGGSNFTASLEYGLAKDTDPVTGDEYTPMAVQLIYGFNNKVSLEVEYYNYTKVDKDGQNENKIVIRPRVKF